MKHFGLIGERLGHSHSKTLHGYLADYSYELWPMPRDAVDSFLKTAEFDGTNVTIPYKQTVIPYLAEMGETARRVGCVNTIVKRADGTLYGDNTDVYGMSVMAARAGIDFAGKKTLILGSGGTSLTAQAVVRAAGGEAVVVSRNGENNYENLEKHADADYLINTTPVGMYPNTGVSPMDLALFPKLEAVLDLIYNPARTQLLLDAEKRGIIAENGLWMLVAQAKEAAEWFLNKQLPDSLIRFVYDKMRRQMENIILIGMPGCGKSTVGRLLADKLGKTFADADEELVKTYGTDIPAIFATEGEAGFREKETSILTELGKRAGLVIATGGGCVTKEINYPLLHQNGTIFWLQRDLDRLPSDGRPLSQVTKMEDMYRIRKPLYGRFADYAIDNNGAAEQTAAQILAKWEA